MVTGGYAGDIAVDDLNMDNVPCANSSLVQKKDSSSMYMITLYYIINVSY